MSEKSDRLRQARINAGYSSATAAARALSLSVSTYTAHENGQNDFDVDQARHYAKTFKTTAGWLLLGVNAPEIGIDDQLREIPHEDAQRLIAEFNNMIRAVKLIRQKK